MKLFYSVLLIAGLVCTTTHAGILDDIGNAVGKITGNDALGDAVGKATGGGTVKPPEKSNDQTKQATEKKSDSPAKESCSKPNVEVKNDKDAIDIQAVQYFNEANAKKAYEAIIGNKYNDATAKAIFSNLIKRDKCDENGVGESSLYYSGLLYSHGVLGICPKNEETAISYLEKCISCPKRAKQPETQLKLGEIYETRQEYDKAIAHYLKAIELNPESNAPKALWRMFNSGIRVKKKELFDAAYGASDNSAALAVKQLFDGNNKSANEMILKEITPEESVNIWFATIVANLGNEYAIKYLAAIKEQKNTDYAQIPAEQANNQKNFGSASSITAPAKEHGKLSYENSIIPALPLIILGTIGLIVLLGVILGFCGTIVIYASWWDIAMSGSVVISCFFSIIFMSKFDFYVFGLPLVFALGLLIRGRYLNRSLFKAIIAFPTQIAGITIVFLLFMLSLSAITNAFEKDSSKNYKNSRAERTIFFSFAGLFALLGTGALKLIQMLIHKGRDNATRLVFDDLEEERRKRNGEKKKSWKDYFREGYAEGSHGDDSEYKAKQEEEEKRKREETESRVEKDDAYYASVLGVGSKATQEEVKKAYRKKSKEYHPDLVAGLGDKLKKMAESEMRDINEAYMFFQKKLGFS